MSPLISARVKFALLVTTLVAGGDSALAPLPVSTHALVFGTVVEVEIVETKKQQNGKTQSGLDLSREVIRSLQESEAITAIQDSKSEILKFNQSRPGQFQRLSPPLNRILHRMSVCEKWNGVAPLLRQNKSWAGVSWTRPSEHVALNEAHIAPVLQGSALDDASLGVAQYADVFVTLGEQWVWTGAYDREVSLPAVQVDISQGSLASFGDDDYTASVFAKTAWAAQCLARTAHRLGAAQFLTLKIPPEYNVRAFFVETALAGPSVTADCAWKGKLRAAQVRWQCEH